MNSPRPMHLTEDDFDALLQGSAPDVIHVHLEACQSCRAIAAADSSIVAALNVLPRFQPSERFADRILARVLCETQPETRSILRRPTWQPRDLRPFARAAMVAIVLVGGMSASVMWSLDNRDRFDTWTTQGLALLDRLFWVGFQAIATQPWYEPARDAVGSRGGLGITLAAITVAYGVGLLVLRRLITPPTRSLPHAA